MMTATRNDYSWTESAATFWAALTLAVMAVTSLLLRYVTDPVTCHTPAQYTAAHNSYANQVCFQSQYIYDLGQSKDDTQGAPPNHFFTYHQWISFFLGACAMFCLLPHALWRIFSSFLWLDAHTLVQRIADNQKNETSAGRHVVLHDCALLLQEGFKGGNSVLSFAALGRKALVAAISFIQLVLMAKVFAPQLSGLKETEEDDDGHQDDGNVTIPLPVTEFLCRYEIRQRRHVHLFMVQCVMPLAQVYSKGLAFLFYTFLVLLVLCALDMAVWAGRLFVPGLKDVTLLRYLSVAISQSKNSCDSNTLNNFLQNLGPDGRLLLAVTGDCCGPLAVSDLTNHLWAVFKGTPPPGSEPPQSLGTAPSAAPGSASGFPGAIPMITIVDDDGPVTEDEKGESC